MGRSGAGGTFEPEMWLLGVPDSRTREKESRPMLRPKNRVSLELPRQARPEDWRLRPERISRRLYLEEARARQTDSSIFNIRNK
jgi:hypothetical protein